MHVHVSALDALVLMAYFVILATAWRLTAAKLVEKEGALKSLGEAMATIL